jgi:hypothetical protein
MEDTKFKITLDSGGVGGVIALFLSFATHHSVFWAIVHFFCSWFYVVYWILRYYGNVTL